jgi:hypothetical protein
MGGNGQGFIAPLHRPSRRADRCPTRSRRSARSSWRIARTPAPHRSDCVGHPDQEVGAREEERGRRSELAALGCPCLGEPEVFGPHRYERGAMLNPLGTRGDLFAAAPDANGAMPDASGEAHPVVRTARRRVGSDAPIEPRDAMREGRHAPPVPRGAPPVACDRRPAPPDAPLAPRHASLVSRDASPVLGVAPPARRDAPRVGRDARPAPPVAAPVPRDAPRIRGDAVRRRRRRSRRVIRSRRASWGARPIPSERDRVGWEFFGARDLALGTECAKTSSPRILPCPRRAAVCRLEELVGEASPRFLPIPGACLTRGDGAPRAPRHPKIASRSFSAEILTTCASPGRLARGQSRVAPARFLSWSV